MYELGSRSYPSVLSHDLGVHILDEHVERSFPFLREDGRVEGRLLAVNHCGKRERLLMKTHADVLKERWKRLTLD